MPDHRGTRRVVAKTADYTVLASDSGTFFTTRGAGGAVNFTLPATSGLAAGWNATFFAAADQNMTVTSPTADTMTVFNDLTADSIAFSTSSEKIGNAVEVIWDGTGWNTLVFLGAETATPTIAT